MRTLSVAPQLTSMERERVILQVLGPVQLRRTDGTSLPGILTQPRPLAVLAYLALARPHGLHSRDTLLALLWPEASQASGRHALRNALHAIRRALGDEVLITAGEGRVGLNTARVVCDAIELERHLAGGRLEDAVNGYDGELLQGFFVSDAPDFERWLDGERQRLRDAVRVAAWTLVECHEQRGEFAEAATAAKRACALTPDDEHALGRLMDLLVSAGDRVGALRAFDEFAARLETEYGLAPSTESDARAEAIRCAPRSPRTRGRDPSPPASARGIADPAAPAARAASTATRWRRARGMAIALVATLAGAFVLARGGPSVHAERDDALTQAARSQATALGASLPARYRADTAQFKRYLRAEILMDRRLVPAARDSFRELTEAAPLYAPAWTGYASALGLSGFFDLPPGEALPRSVAAAQRGLALDSTLVEGTVVLIANDMFGRWDLDAAHRRLVLAMRRDPDDATLINLLAAWYRWRGDLPNAVRLKRRASELQSLSVWFPSQVAWDLYLSHRCAEAAEVYWRLAKELRDNAEDYAGLYRSYKCMGQMDDAAAALRLSLLASGDSVLARRLEPPLDPARRTAAIHTTFRAYLTRFMAGRRHGWVPPVMAAATYAELGNSDSTLIWLDSMYVDRSMMLHSVPFDPTFDFLRSDPRFQAFITRLPWKPRLDLAGIPPVRAHRP